MILTKEDVSNHGLLNELTGSSVVYRYQKTGGVFVCPKCGKYLGTPKHSRNGVIVETLKRKSCCGTKAVLKGAEIVTHPGSITRAILRTDLHGEIKAKAVLNREDKFDKKVAREIAFDKLMKKAKALEPVWALKHD
jgi:hypothetical protein